VVSAVTLNAITTGSYVIRQRINEPSYALYASFIGGTNFRAEDLYGLLGIALGVQTPNNIGTTDYLANMQVSLHGIAFRLPVPVCLNHLTATTPAVEKGKPGVQYNI
jgi:hypothetical protein